MQVVGPTTLPAVCENVSNVQLRWIYFQIAPGNGGTRPRMSVDEINVTSTVISGIMETNLQSNHVTIYPNPASSLITIVTSLAGKKEVRIYNSLGDKAAELFSTENKINIARSNFPDGFYLVEVIDENGISISKSKLILY
jgi:hypothetical protein